MTDEELMTDDPSLTLWSCSARRSQVMTTIGMSLKSAIPDILGVWLICIQFSWAFGVLTMQLVEPRYLDLAVRPSHP
eukprot:386094-Prymnesium_polylepis.2